MPPGRSHPPHLGADRGADAGVENRRKARELRDEVERGVIERKLGGAPGVQVERRISATPLIDPILHEVDPARLVRAVLDETVQEIARPAAQIEHSG